MKISQYRFLGFFVVFNFNVSNISFFWSVLCHFMKIFIIISLIWKFIWNGNIFCSNISLLVCSLRHYKVNDSQTKHSACIGRLDMTLDHPKTLHKVVNLIDSAWIENTQLFHSLKTVLKISWLDNDEISITVIIITVFNWTFLYS